VNKLYVLKGPQAGKSFDLRDGANYIGRSSQDIQIDDPTVSREHLKITALCGIQESLSSRASHKYMFIRCSKGSFGDSIFRQE